MFGSCLAEAPASAASIKAGSRLLKETMFDDYNAGRACRIVQSRPEP